MILSITNFQLLTHNVHLSTALSTSSGNLTPYLLGKKQGFNIINLNYTQLNLKLFVFFLTRMSSLRQKILTTNHKYIANWTYTGLPRYFSERHEGKWLGGLLTNYKTIRTSKRFKRIDYKHQVLIKRFPVAVIILNSTTLDWPTKEAVLLKIPSMSIVDGDSLKPNRAAYNIPGNNTTWGAINFYFKLIRAAMSFGLELEKYNTF